MSANESRDPAPDGGNGEGAASSSRSPDVGGASSPASDGLGHGGSAASPDHQGQSSPASDVWDFGDDSDVDTITLPSLFTFQPPGQGPQVTFGASANDANSDANNEEAIIPTSPIISVDEFLPSDDPAAESGEDVFELQLDYSLPDIGRRLAGACEMTMQIAYLRKELSYLETRVLEVLLPENSPWHLCIRAIEVERREATLRALGRLIRVGHRPFGLFSLNFGPLDRSLPYFTQGLRRGQEIVAELHCAREMICTFEDTVRRVLRPENTPWTLSIGPHEISRMQSLLNVYGRLLRVGPDRTEDPRYQSLLRGNNNSLGRELPLPPLYVPLAFRPSNFNLLQHLHRNSSREAMLRYLAPVSRAPVAENLLAPSPVTGAATSVAINALPTRQYEWFQRAHEAVTGQSCAICREAFKDGDIISELPCHHFFHKDCVDHWLRQCGRCPMCRTPMPDTW